MPDNTLVRTTHTYTRAGMHMLIHTQAHITHTLIHPYNTHRFLSHTPGSPKSASLPSNANTSASCFPNQPVNSGQERQKPPSPAQGSALHTWYSETRLRPSVKPEAKACSSLGFPCGLGPILHQKGPDSNYGQCLVTLERTTKSFSQVSMKKNIPLPFSSVLPGGPAVAPGPRLSSQG